MPGNMFMHGCQDNVLLSTSKQQLALSSLKKVIEYVNKIKYYKLITFEN
jgi:hypothetical protein